jgi:hypothetical protein
MACHQLHTSFSVTYANFSGDTLSKRTSETVVQHFSSLRLARPSATCQSLRGVFARVWTSSATMVRVVVSVPFPVESGLSECARNPSALGCDGSGLAFLVLSIPVMVMWLLLAATATAMIAKRHPRRSAVWFAIVWCLPILGALCWFSCRAGIRASRRTTAD